MAKPDTPHNTRLIVEALEADPAAAETKTALADATGLTPAQIEYLLYSIGGDARVAWDIARATLAERKCDERRCSQCRLTYPASEFPRDKSDPCGIARRCGVCNRLNAREHYLRRKTAAG